MISMQQHQNRYQSTFATLGYSGLVSSWLLMLICIKDLSRATKRETWKLIDVSRFTCSSSLDMLGRKLTCLVAFLGWKEIQNRKLSWANTIRNIDRRNGQQKLSTISFSKKNNENEDNNFWSHFHSGLVTWERIVYTGVWQGGGGQLYSSSLSH